MTSNIVHRVVRGEEELHNILNHPFDISFDGEKWLFGPPRMPPLRISEEDIVAGIRALVGDKQRIIEWARFVLSASNLIELDILEKSPFGNDLIECLWDLSEGELGSARAIIERQ